MAEKKLKKKHSIPSSSHGTLGYLASNGSLPRENVSKGGTYFALAIARGYVLKYLSLNSGLPKRSVNFPSKDRSTAYESVQPGKTLDLHGRFVRGICRLKNATKEDIVHNVFPTLLADRDVMINTCRK